MINCYFFWSENKYRTWPISWDILGWVGEHFFKSKYFYQVGRKNKKQWKSKVDITYKRKELAVGIV